MDSLEHVIIRTRYTIFTRVVNFFRNILNFEDKVRKKYSANCHVRVIPREQHSISRKNISKNALKVLYRLNKSGYEAYLVGGGVRDLLLGKKPKDFDVATNATPDQMRKVFRNCRLVGKRFRLAHVMFRQEIIEVATFRGTRKNIIPANDCIASQYSRNGILLHDNIFGSIEEDASRRDFTINSLYYSVEDFTVRDYVGGMQDLKSGLIRIIGNPETRYREDPVRMLRAVRFAAKLRMNIVPETSNPISHLALLINDVSPARLFEEAMKLLQTGFGLEAYKLLCKYNLFHLLFPSTAHHFSNNWDSLIEQITIKAIKNIDIRIRNNMEINPAFLFTAIFLYPLLKTAKDIARDKNIACYDAFLLSINIILHKACHTLAIPRNIITTIRDVWCIQFRMFDRKNKKAWKLVENSTFRTAYNLLLLRAEVEKKDELYHLVQWWKTFRISSMKSRKEMLKKLSKPKASRCFRNRTHKKTSYREGAT